MGPGILVGQARTQWTQYSIGVSPMDDSAGFKQGRSYGGAAILWNIVIENMIQTVEIDSSTDWTCGINVISGTSKLLLLNVYLPYEKDCGTQLQKYLDCLAKIETVIQENPTTSVIILGDFNADISKGPC